MSDSKKAGDQKIWMVGDVLNAMSAPLYPEFMEKSLAIVQEWLNVALSGEYPLDMEEMFSGNTERYASSNAECLLDRLDWLNDHVDLIPADSDIRGREDAVVLSVGPIILDEGFRMAVDHAAIFNRGECKRLWIVADNWIPGDVAVYAQHIRALRTLGVSIRFFLVTQWGWVELPIYSNQE